MTNLDNILKSRDTTLPTKVHLVKAVVFPVVIYGCENWTIFCDTHLKSIGTSISVNQQDEKPGHPILSRDES